MDSKKVFVIIEDWRIDSGESGIEISVFSTYKKAKKEYFRLKENYLKDYESEDLKIEERIEDDNTFIELEGTNECNADYFNIKVVDKEVE